MIPPVTDTGPLLTFARANRLELLRAVVPQLILPPTVFDEIAVQGAGRPGADQIELGLGTWVLVRPLSDPSILHRVKALDPGEREAIALAIELGRHLLIDERLGRAEARRLNVPLLSTLAVLEEARSAGIIPAVKPELNALIAAGFRLSKALYEGYLHDVEEQP